MKKIILIVATILLTVVCSKDEPTVPNPLIGIWESVSQQENLDGSILISKTVTLTFNSNWTFVFNEFKEKNDTVYYQRTSNGTYSIFEKDKLIIHIKYDDYYDNPNVEFNDTIPFRIGRNEKGEYLLFYNYEDDFYKHYKK